MSWITGRRPEYLDAKFVSKSDGREVTRVKSSGSVKVTLNVNVKDIERFGYATTANGRADTSSFSSMAHAA